MHLKIIKQACLTGLVIISVVPLEVGATELETGMV